MSGDFFAEQLARIFIEQVKTGSKKPVVYLVKKTLSFQKYTVFPLLNNSSE